MITIVISTIDRSPNPNYLLETLDNLKRAGVLESPHLHSVHIVDSGSPTPWPPQHEFLTSSKVRVHRPLTRRSAKWNCAAALRIGAETGAAWVVHLEDDLDVCADFVGSIARWLAKYGVDDRLNVFSGDNPAFMADFSVWNYPVEIFWGLQCFAVSPAVALDIAEWFETHGLPEDNAHDIDLHRWAAFNGITHFVGAAKSFVQHTGQITSIANNPNGGHLVSFPSWPGRQWTYD